MARFLHLKMARVLLSLVVLAAASAEKPLVRVDSGQLGGSWEMSAAGRPYASFKGVPYARPPVGKYRFREPQPLKPWAGTWDASRHLSSCMQYDPLMDKILGNEDCLFLNVYTPRLAAGAGLPVLVFIHGGAFMFGGSSAYNPRYLMDTDMVVVTLNYRLGPLGFLSTGDDVIPGNAGLKDQAFALQWVQRNIWRFGGNPDSVTLSGSSAGAASAHYQALTPLSKGTFARAIAFSGSALVPWGFDPRPAAHAAQLAQAAGCPGGSRELADCLRYRPAEVVLEGMKEMFEWRLRPYAIFLPVAESPRSREPFMTEAPYQAVLGGASHAVPFIFSVTTEEGLYPAALYQSDPSILPEIEAKWYQLSHSLFEYNETLPLPRRDAVAKSIRQHYLGDRPVSQETYAQLVQALSERHFDAPVGKAAQAHATYVGQPTYVYRYGFRGEQSLSWVLAGNKNDYGVAHTDDVFRIFDFAGLESSSAQDVEMTKALVCLVYSFALNGVPSTPNATWTPLKPAVPDLDYLYIAAPESMMMQSTQDFGQRSFWDALGFAENENYRKDVKEEL